MSEPPAEAQQEARQLEALAHGYLMDDVSAAAEAQQDDDHVRDEHDVEAAQAFALAHDLHPLPGYAASCLACRMSTAEAFRLGYRAALAARPSADTEPAMPEVVFVTGIDAAPVVKAGEGPLVVLSVTGLVADVDGNLANAEEVRFGLAFPTRNVNDVRRALRLAYMAIEPEDRSE